MNQTAIQVDNESLASRADEALQQLLYSAHAFAAVAVPVAISMILSSLAVVFINDGLNGNTSGGTGIPVVFQETGSESADTRLANALVNALVIIAVVIFATFLMVFLYYYNFMRTLIGWLVISTGMLLAFSTGLVVQTAMRIYNIPFDAVSYSLIFYNFAVVGITAVFYQRGVPAVITGGYLIAISVTMAWILLRFLPEWTTWALLALLALYDLCAVLTPCGPLNCLVGINESMQDRDEPLPGLLYEARIQRNNNNNPNNNQGYSQSVSSSSRTLEAYQLDVERQLQIIERYHQQQQQLAQQQQQQSTTAVVKPISATSDNSSTVGGSNESSPQNPVAIRELSEHGSRTSNNEQTAVRNAPSYASEDRVSTQGSVMMEVPPPVPDNRPSSSQVRQMLTQQQQRPQGPPQQQIRPPSQMVIDEDPDRSIKLGLGDFVFYSLLCARAALVSFTTFIAVFVVVLFGLALTLILLAVYRTALPALPISILLGLLFFFACDSAVVPFVIDFSFQIAYS